MTQNLQDHPSSGYKKAKVAKASHYPSAAAPYTPTRAQPGMNTAHGPHCSNFINKQITSTSFKVLKVLTKVLAPKGSSGF